jgi:hypothetical protein
MVEMNRRFDEIEQWYFSDTLKLNDEFHSGGMYYILKMMAWYGQFGAVPRSIGQMMGSLLCPAIEAWRAANRRQEAEFSLLHLLFALEAYHRDNGGKYPDTLDALLGRYIDAIPLDPFSGESFRYIVEPPGYLLYSVGPNGIDEDGRDRSDTPKGDDLRRRVPIR